MCFFKKVVRTTILQGLIAFNCQYLLTLKYDPKYVVNLGFFTLFLFVAVVFFVWIFFLILFLILILILFSYQLWSEVLLCLSMGCFCYYYYYLQRIKDHPAASELQVISLLSLLFLKSHICYLEISAISFIFRSNLFYRKSSDRYANDLRFTKRKMTTLNTDKMVNISVRTTSFTWIKRSYTWFTHQAHLQVPLEYLIK